MRLEDWKSHDKRSPRGFLGEDPRLLANPHRRWEVLYGAADGLFYGGMEVEGRREAGAAPHEEGFMHKGGDGKHWSVRLQSKMTWNYRSGTIQ